MKLKMITGVMIILVLMSMLTIAVNLPPILADAGTDWLPDDNSTVQKADGGKPLNLTDCHESFVSEGLNRNTSAKENTNFYSIDEDRWNFNSTNEWTAFAKVDCESAELIVGVNNGNPNNYANIVGLIDESDGDSVGTVSMDGEIRAVVADIPLGTISSFVTEVRDAGLSSYIEPNMKFQACFVPDDLYWSYQWGPRIIEANYAWNTTLGDPSVLVAVIDTGIDWNHPDLAANYVPLGYDWVNDDTNPMDDEGHGTHCAGIIAAVINNSIGVAGLVQVKIMAEKGLDSGGYGTEDDLANAIIHAVDQGADILSNSWGAYGESELIHDAVRYANDAGVLVIAAAGNEATSTKLYPAAYDEVIAVTATDEYDNPASFPGWWGTNFGDWVELAAPGVDIYSTVWDDSYAYNSGTSTATPHVAGVAALILSQFPTMTRDQVRLQLRFTADDLGDAGFDDYYGYGRINARKAVEQAPPDHDLLILDWETPLFVEPGELTFVNTTVFNFGTSNETDITVQLLVNGTIVDSAAIGFLETATSETVNCSWTPAVEGTYNLTSYVVLVLDEIFTANNFVTAMVDVGYFKYILFDQTHWTDSIVMYDTWANTLSERGYVVDVHTSGPITPTVLADYVAFVIPQAHDPYFLEELSAIQSFVVAGGGLLVIGDDAPSVYTDLTAFAGISWVGGGCSGITTDVMPHEVTQGVTSVYLSAPIAEMVVGSFAQDLVRDPRGGIMLAVSEHPGRVIGFADEDSLWDYSITQEDNLLLANNMIDWLVFQPEHDLAVILDTPHYVEPGDSSLLNVTVRNRGLSNETDVELFLFINGTIVKNETAPEIISDSSYTMDYLWTPAGEKVMYNVTGYAVPVENETVTANNLEWAYVYVGVPVKAFVLDSAGTDNSGIISTWQLLTTNWYMFGEKITFIDYTTLNIEDLTYEDLAATDADVLIISCASDQYHGWEFTDSEIEAIGQYVQEGHGLIATSGTFYGMVPNNNKLAPLFGLNETITYHQSYTDLLHIEDPTHPLFNNVPNPYTFPEIYTAFPSDGQWDSNELAGGEYVALGHFQESAIVVYRGLVYISPLLEYGIPLYYHHHLQLLYNAITWSSYQKPEHELVVSLEAPTRLELGESTLINATVFNFGLNNETNVELLLLINGATVENETIPQLLTGSSHTLSHLWTPTVGAIYNVTAYAPPIPNETVTQNNLITKIVTVVTPPPEANWILLATDPDEGLGTNLKAIYSQLYSDIVYFKVEHYRPWTTINDINTGIFVDADQDPSTGLPDEVYPGQNTDMGADYLIVVGFEATKMWRWDPIAGLWDVGNPISLAYFDAPDSSNVFVVGAYLTDVETAGTLDCAVTDTISDWDWIPDSGHFTWFLIRYEHELIVFLDAPQRLQPSETSLLNATVNNIGLNNETNVELQLLINGTIVNNETISDLVNGTSHTIDYLWTPTVEATYNITAYAPPVHDENIIVNNVRAVNVTVSYVIAYVAVLNAVEVPSYWTGGWGNDYQTLVDALIDSGFYAQAVTNEEIIAGILDYFEVFVMIDNVPNDAAVEHVYDFWSNGGGIVAFDSSICFLCYAGILPPESAGSNGYYVYWDYNTGSTAKVSTAHPVTDGYPVGQLISGQAGDAEYLVSALAGTIAYPYYTKLAEDVSISDHAYVSAYEPPSGGRAVHIWDQGHWSNTDLQRMILNAMKWASPFKYEHELVVSLEAPTSREPGDSSLLNATVLNYGLSNETNVELYLLINGTEVNSTTIPELLTGESYTINYLWTPTIEAIYNITAYAPPVPDENVTANNYVNKMVHVRYVTVALISDQSQLLAITPILDSMGISYDSYDDNSMYLYTEDLDLLLSYQTVIFYTGYRHITSNEYTALESYLSSGGNLLVTGFDSLVSDDLLRDLIRSATIGDNVGEPDLYVVDATHPIMSGPYGSFPAGYHISGLYSDCDAVEADTARMAVTVAELADGYDKIIATDGLPGKVVYWNGIGSEDWMWNVDCETIFKNTLAWFLIQYEHELTVSLDAPTFLKPGESSLVNATIYNRGLSNETNVELYLLINGTEVNSTTIPELLTGTSYTLSYMWTPTVEATYNVTAYAPPVIGESFIINNVASVNITVMRMGILAFDKELITWVLGSEPSDRKFDLKINITDVTDLKGIIFSVEWDPTVLNCTSYTPGDFMPTGLPEAMGWLMIWDRPAGKMKEVINHFLHGYGPASVSKPDWGWVMTLHFDYVGTPPTSGSPIDTEIHIVKDPDAEMETKWRHYSDVYYDFDYLSAPHVHTCHFHYAYVLVGDVNGDGKVDYEDLFLLADAYGSDPSDDNWDPRCDFNGDGHVGWWDLFALADNYGT